MVITVSPLSIIPGVAIAVGVLAHHLGLIHSLTLHASRRMPAWIRSLTTVEPDRGAVAGAVLTVVDPRCYSYPQQPIGDRHRRAEYGRLLSAALFVTVAAPSGRTIGLIDP